MDYCTINFNVFFFTPPLSGYDNRWSMREYRSAPYQRILPSTNLSHLYIERDASLLGAKVPAHVLSGCSHCPNCTRVSTAGSVVLVRHIHVGSRRLDKEPAKASSKVEEAVNLLKGKAKDELEAKEQQVVVPKKSLTTRIIEEVKHYYHGFRLLFVDINISRKLAMKALRGETLSRREHRLVSIPMVD